MYMYSKMICRSYQRIICQLGLPVLTIIQLVFALCLQYIPLGASAGTSPSIANSSLTIATPPPPTGTGTTATGTIGDTPTTFSATPSTVGALQAPTTVRTTVCVNRISTCSQYGRTPCTSKVYEAWAKHNCELYCGFCEPKRTSLYTDACRNTLPNCAEYDSGALCTTDSYYAWAYDHCKGYCKFDRCNDTCEDTVGIDCSTLNATLNICADKDKAKLVCRSYCDLCHIVDGGWSQWLSWGECGVTCGNGSQIRQRQCNAPPPSGGGDNCHGSDHASQSCTSDPCPVPGGWSSWSVWGTCSVTCGQGLQRRDRYCTEPYPSLQGDHCFGTPIDFQVCNEDCSVGNWSAWSNWSRCKHACSGSLRFRERNCSAVMTGVPGGHCEGTDIETEACACTVRLAGGTYDELELFNNGTWKRVHYTSFTNNAAKVVCRMLGYPWQSASFTYRTGRQAEQVELSNVTCSGTELSIDECTARSLSETNGANLVITCKFLAVPPALHVRLTGGADQYEGRLDVFHGGEWGTVCDDDFTNAAASVVCNMLKLPSVNAHFVRTSSSSTSLKIWLDSVQCTGSESDISSCRHDSWGSNDCSHPEDVYIYCMSTSQTETSFTATGLVPGPERSTIAFSTLMHIPVSNRVSGYNTTTGKFTSYMPGLYHFSVTLTKNSKYSGVPAHCFLRLNYVNMVLLHIDPGDSASNSGSISVTLRLDIGDRVDLGDCSSAMYFESSSSVFTGYHV